MRPISPVTNTCSMMPEHVFAVNPRYRIGRTTVVVRVGFVSATSRTASVSDPAGRASRTRLRRFCATAAVAHVAVPADRPAITRRALERVWAPRSTQTRADAASAAMSSTATARGDTRATGFLAPWTERSGRHADEPAQALPAKAAATSAAAGRAEPSTRYRPA